MAFKKLQNKQVNAQALGKDKGCVKQISGYLTGVELDRGARKNSTIYALQQKDGTIQKVWGSYALDSVLLTGAKNTRRLNPSVVGIMTRFTFISTTEFGKGKKKQSVKNIDVEVDTNEKLASSLVKPYIIKKS